MISLTAICLAFIISIVLQLWAVAWAARRVGSPRGRMRVAFGAFVVSSVIDVVLSLIIGQLFTAEAQKSLAFAGGSAFLSLAITFVVLRSAFRLSFATAWAPFGAWLGSAILVFVVVLFAIRPYVTEAFIFPTKGMMPTINPGDRFLVNKFSHPRRWDLVAYWNIGAERSIFCKRLIGLPGEHVRFEGGTIYINDQPANVPAVLAGRCRASTPGFTEPRYAEGQTISLGMNEYFVIGDNIDISGDSRHFGPSDKSSLVGVVDFIYWPLDKMKIVR